MEKKGFVEAVFQEKTVNDVIASKMELCRDYNSRKQTEEMYSKPIRTLFETEAKTKKEIIF